MYLLLPCPPTVAVTQPGLLNLWLAVSCNNILKIKITGVHFSAFTVLTCPVGVRHFPVILRCENLFKTQLQITVCWLIIVMFGSPFEAKESPNLYFVLYSVLTENLRATCLFLCPFLLRLDLMSLLTQQGLSDSLSQCWVGGCGVCCPHDCSARSARAVILLFYLQHQYIFKLRMRSKISFEIILCVTFFFFYGNKIWPAHGCQRKSHITQIGYCVVSEQEE